MSTDSPEPESAAEAAYSPTVEPAPDPQKTSKSDLVKAAEIAGIAVDGLTKDELADAIDTGNVTGRPPLAQVAQDAHARDEALATTVVVDDDHVIAETAPSGQED